MIGRVVGKYKILQKIGEGGMGSVYAAEHTILGSPAAIKVLLPQWTSDAVVVDRFFHEARAASAIRHAGIVDVFDYGRLDNEQAWIAMELLRGETLTQLFMRNGGPLDPAVVQQIGAQILGALDAAHVVGVVHRDLKPDNVFLVRDPGLPGGIRVKLLDFGIAKLGADRFGNKRKTGGGTILGTPTYMAPEQCKAGGEIDARADLYALGCILFELLVGGPPFNAPGGGEVMAMHIYEPPPRLSRFQPQLPAELDALIARLLVKNPADRIPSAAYALAELERVSLLPLAAQIMLIGADGGRAPTYGPVTEYLPPPESHDAARIPRWIPVAVLVVAIAIAIAAIILIGNSGNVPGAKT
ncbi:MAG TPA: serine/threonine-protein kinase [Kofleriaceae bacterium]|nr:serine/threonine-protein kinase [Kofleriaceae bacterium]